MKYIKVGILGDGQLSKMLVESASPLGLKPTVYSGDRKDIKTLSTFFSQVDTVIFESEFFDKEDLEKAAKSSKNGTLFYPSLDTMELLRDKLNQKKLLLSLKIPTSKFIELSTIGSIEHWIVDVLKKFKFKAVLKFGRLGYDGKGVFFLNKENIDEAKLFCEKAREMKVSLYAEEMLSFKRELAITGCYSTKKEFASYPLVKSVQENGICVKVQGPAVLLGVKKSREAEAKKYLKKIAKKCSLFGSFSIELFEMANGKLLVNEIAPRVHNSAHYTQNGSHTSQFENHLRAILGLPLGSTESVGFFAMENLLGPDSVTLKNDEAPRPIPTSGIHLHWYNKDVKPGRKVGHLNAIGKDGKHFAKILKELEKCRKDWESR